MEQEAHARLIDLRIHRSEQDTGWSAVLQAFTIGQRWFWMYGDQEVSTLVPVNGMPYTKDQHCFLEYLELTNEH